MELKTRIHAEPNKQELFITREFDLPLDLLFKAYTVPELIEQWMGTRVLKLENHNHGSYRFETTDPMGNKHGFNGTIHQFISDQKIIRTFEMESANFGAQIEFLDFEAMSDTGSKLNIQIVFRSVEIRDEMLKLPFAQGLNMAHNRLQDLFK